ncbi:Quorum-sensing regulator protein D [Variovorax sp. PBS-H4]|uniref:LysR family transcriptional regulator n=1 Tax=Variovorax sp. PBS-H4 TaxID=434008 RepID=UPI0013190D42|nr:LysR family transcriptional regulator [Variovorax sp. PBS-H4]VTU27936.1 Quorum-sensing regulator protein D [Variovorax sp. PBS-H4]
MQTAWFEDLIALSETRSFSRAAERRHLTQPAFGRRIRALEQWAGTPLVLSNRAPVALTPAGDRLVQYAVEAVQAMALARDDLKGLHASARETVTLVAGRTLARTIAADWLARVKRKTAAAEIRVRTGSMAETLKWLEQGEAEFMLAYHHPAIAVRLSSAHFLQRTLAHDKLVPLARAGLLPSTGDMGSAKPLPYLAYSEKLALGRLVRDHLINHAQAPRLAQRIESDSADALLEYAIKGLGVAWLPWSLAVGACKDGRLAPVGGKSLQIGFEVRVVRPKRRLGPVAESVWSAVDSA